MASPRRTASTAAPATCTTRTRTRSGRTARCTRAPALPARKALSTGHIDGRRDAKRESALEQFERLHPWDECQDCAFIPTCAGGCLVASHTQLGDMNKPTCHKRSFESALISLAHDVASAA